MKIASIALMVLVLCTACNGVSVPSSGALPKVDPQAPSGGGNGFGGCYFCHSNTTSSLGPLVNTPWPEVAHAGHTTEEHEHVY